MSIRALADTREALRSVEQHERLSRAEAIGALRAALDTIEEESAFRGPPSESEHRANDDRQHEEARRLLRWSLPT